MDESHTRKGQSAPFSVATPRKRRAVVRRGKELHREARYLLKKRGKTLTADVHLAFQAQVSRLALALKRKGRTPDEARDIGNAALDVDSTLQNHLARYRKSILREYMESIVWAVGLALLIRFFAFAAFSIPSGSMIPTLEIGDHIFVSRTNLGLYIPFSSSRLIHWGEPERGDIIVFEFRLKGSLHDGEDYIKRVVGVAGDRVRLEDNTLVVNGTPVPTENLGNVSCSIYGEDGAPVAQCPCVQQQETVGDHVYITQHMKPPGDGFSLAGCHNMADWPFESPAGSQGANIGVKKGRRGTAPNGSWPDILVPEGHVFVMGDNRDRSEDGRFWGFVPLDRVRGTAFVTWLPISRWGSLN